VNAFERKYITEVLEKVNNNRKKAAKILEVHRNTLNNKLNELGLKS